jgi:hypothetical protein
MASGNSRRHHRRRHGRQARSRGGVVSQSSGLVEVEVKPVDRPGKLGMPAREGSRNGRGRRDKAVW